MRLEVLGNPRPTAWRESEAQGSANSVRALHLVLPQASVTSGFSSGVT